MKALLRDALNNLRHRRAATLVSVAGLTVALAACLLIALLAIALSSIDPTMPEPERIVLLDFKGNPPGQPSPWFTASPMSFGTLLKERNVPVAPGEDASETFALQSVRTLLPGSLSLTPSAHAAMMMFI